MIWGSFDLILCNPPYVETEAELAPQVQRARTGLGAVRRCMTDWTITRMLDSANFRTAHLAEHGVCNIRDWPEGRIAVGHAAGKSEQGFAIQPHRDLAGIIRALSLSKPGSG
jgi:hypothetical protein